MHIFLKDILQTYTLSKLKQHLNYQIFRKKNMFEYVTVDIEHFKKWNKINFTCIEKGSVTIWSAFSLLFLDLES